MSTWQEQRGELLDKQADEIDGVVLYLRRCIGIWEHGSPLDVCTAEAIGKYGAESENLRKQAMRLKSEGAEVARIENDLAAA